MTERRSLSMPYWCVGNPVGDPFGPGVLDRVSSLEVTDLLCEAKENGLIDLTSAHDDDLVPWNPAFPEDDLDEKTDTFKTLTKIRDKLDHAGLKFNLIGCGLHGDPVFRNGGLANPDPRVRLLAAQKVMRALRIGSFFNANYFTYWVARDGFETQFSVPWNRAYGYIIDSLNLARRYAAEKKLSFKGMTIEHKPNEPRGEMFLPTVGHAIALILHLEDPDFWGVNPEVLQHDQMAGLTSVSAVGFALSLGKLFFLHVGNQKPNQFDNDNPPLIGMDGIKELVSIMWLLNKYEWKGLVEFDNHMLRTDTAPGGKNSIDLRREYIELAVDAYRTLEAKANELVKDRHIAEAQSRLWEADADITTLLASGDIAKIASARVDYDGIVREPLRLGALDLQVNKKIFGM
jgi:xylose isomerase